MPLTGEACPIPPGWRRWKKYDGNTTSGDTVFNQDFKEFLQSLNDNGVRYLVVGGYAVALHGYPRYTKDIDVWVEMTAEKARRSQKRLSNSGLVHWE